MTEATRSAKPSDQSAGDLVKELSEQVSRLVRDELKLARVEMTSKGKRAGAGAGMLGGGGVFAVYGVGCLLAAAIAGLANVIPAWLAALIVGVVVLAVAGVAAVLGKGQLTKAAPPVPERTVGSVKADVAEVKESARRCAQRNTHLTTERRWPWRSSGPARNWARRSRRWSPRRT